MQEENWAHVDLGNQIDNSWNKDTTLALKSGRDKFIVRIRERDKKVLKRKFINKLDSKNRKTRRRIVIMIYCFLLYKLLNESEELTKNVKLCRDINPPKNVYKFLDLISKFYQEKTLNERGFRIKFNNEGHSKAHNLANKSYKGSIKENYLLINEDLKDLDKLIRIFILNKNNEEGSKTQLSVKASSSETIKAAYETHHMNN